MAIDNTLRSSALTDRLARRFVIAIFTVCIAMLAGCAHIGRAELVKVEGTAWAGADSDGDQYTFSFQTSGVLHYASPTGSWTNGTWSQNGTEIHFEMNHHYSEYSGHIEGDEMSGEAWNVVGHRWKWKIRKVKNNA